MPSAIKATETATGRSAAQAASLLRSDTLEVAARIKSITDRRVKTNLLRTSVLAGARVVRDRAKVNAPERTGQLKEDIIARTRRTRRGDKDIRATVTIKNGTRSRHIAHLAEFGTEAHEQRQLNSVHPGAKAQPFLRPAIDENPSEILDAVLKKARERLRKLNV
jgi:HK97 gp10 family phage protein